MGCVELPYLALHVVTFLGKMVCTCKENNMPHIYYKLVYNLTGWSAANIIITKSFKLAYIPVLKLKLIGDIAVPYSNLDSDHGMCMEYRV